MKMQEKRLLGLRIKELRKNKGLSQEELAEKAATSPNYLSRMERGTENPTLAMLIKISRALDVDMWELFEFGHGESMRELKESLVKLVKGPDEERIRLAVKILRAVLR
ncbi:MAG: helix-turn-helix transcriptional regulator [Deltaproteobacteria bacterium]|nr:helix-turn-helix transcriptional regulator [Deltaproteobacteria bacterium]